MRVQKMVLKYELKSDETRLGPLSKLVHSTKAKNIMHFCSVLWTAKLGLLHLKG